MGRPLGGQVRRDRPRAARRPSCHIRMATGMSRAVKAGVLGLVIAATVWALTLWRWRRAPESVSGLDIVLYLVLVPLALTGVAWLAWRAVQRLRELADRPLPVGLPGSLPGGPTGGSTRPPGASVASLASKADTAGDASGTGSDPAQPVATVLAEALSLAAGHEVGLAWHALKEARVRPGLDPTLSDADGLPVFSARAPDLDLADWLLAHAELALPGSAPLPDHVLRTLALLEGPVHALMDALGAWRPQASLGADGRAAELAGGAVAPGLPPDAPSHLSGVGRADGPAWRQARADRAPRLLVRLCLPGAWSSDDRERAVAWVRSQCGFALDWADAHGVPAPEWHTQPLADGDGPESLWSERALNWAAWSASPRPQLLLLLVADTALDEACIAQWQARGELFTSQHQRGRVPGEAAVGLLLANPAWDAWCRQPSTPFPSGALPMQAGEDIGTCPQMWWPQQALRARSADVIGRVDGLCTQGLLQGVVQRLSLPADGDWLLVSDGDHRASRTAEVFEALLAVRPQADPVLSVVRVGDGCGDVGLARSLVSVALASAALRQGEPVAVALALMVQDAWQRVVVPLTRPAGG